MSKKTKHYPKRKANYSLQFWFDKENVLKMTETCQGGDLDKSVDFGLFGLYLADTKVLNYKEKEAFFQFCNSFMVRFNELQEDEE